MLCTRIHRSLYFSERKRKDAGEVEQPRSGTRLEQIVIASEELSGADHWHEVPERTVIGVNRELCLQTWRLDDLVAGAESHGPPSRA
jgi:glutamine amidotransferase